MQFSNLWSEILQGINIKSPIAILRLSRENCLSKSLRFQTFIFRLLEIKPKIPGFFSIEIDNCTKSLKLVYFLQIESMRHKYTHISFFFPPIIYGLKTGACAALQNISFPERDALIGISCSGKFSSPSTSCAARQHIRTMGYKDERNSLIHLSSKRVYIRPFDPKIHLRTSRKLRKIKRKEPMFRLPNVIFFRTYVDDISDVLRLLGVIRLGANLGRHVRNLEILGIRAPKNSEYLGINLSTNK